MQEADRKARLRARAETFDTWSRRVVLPILLVLYIVGFKADENRNNELQSQQTQIAQLIRETTQFRLDASDESCTQYNQVVNGLRTIIISATKSSRAFEKTYRQFGLPSYQERLHQAQLYAAQFGKRDCAASKALIEKQLTAAHQVEQKTK